MKKRILTLAVLASISSMAAVAAEEAEIDMSDPTAVYTNVGMSYGNKGLDFTSMLMLSSSETQKSGMIFEVKNILDEDDHSNNPLTGEEVSNRSYRLRWGTINTVNGLGFSVDAINAEHPFFGDMTVVQTGPLMTIPIGDSFMMWPLVYVGGVFVEDNTLALAEALPKLAGKAAAEKYAKSPELAAAAKKAGADAVIASGETDPAKQLQIATEAGKNFATAAVNKFYNDTATDMANSDEYKAGLDVAKLSSEGMSMASTILTGMVYARYAFTDSLWALGSVGYTTDIQGKSWDDDIQEGGLQMGNTMYDITIGYQLTDTQNVTVNYSGNDGHDAEGDDLEGKWKVGYNYAF